MNPNHLVTSIFFLLISIFNYTKAPSSQANYNEKMVLLEAPIMCATSIGRCTGSAYCTVCKNCSRCAYCNSGGSCGVCGKRPATYSPKKRKKYRTVPKTNTTIKKSARNSYNTPTYLTEDIYVVTKRTSLRQSSTSSAKVLKRLAADDSVQMLDGYSQKYWCKVLHKGKIGWVKKHLLKKRKLGVYP